MQANRRSSPTRVESRMRMLGVWAIAMSGALAAAQQLPLSGFLGSNFLLPEFYDPPHETQVKSLLQGEQALPQGDGKILIKKLKLETFRVDGTGEFILLADDCLYDSAQRRAASPGPLEMKTADGRFFTEGEGFLWQENESILTISNRVHTVIRVGQAEAPKS